MIKIKGLFKLLRFELPFAAGICVVMGQILAIGDFPNFGLLISGFLAVFFISSSILVQNDYFDVETDKINAPKRPIPSKLVKPQEALIFSLFLLLAGLLLSYIINFVILVFAIILTIIGFLYNRYFKKAGLIGNMMVSFSVGMTFIFGGTTVGLPFHRIVIFFAIIAALIDLGEEIAADSMDVDGDRLINSNSLAIKHGSSTALRISIYIFSTVIILSFVPFILCWFSIIYFIPIGIMDFLIVYSTYKLYMGRDSEGRKYIRLLYLGSTLGLIVFLIMRLLKF
jgi:geranylgeranylglycerol-phosphate geranylgeranyltransferase